MTKSNPDTKRTLGTLVTLLGLFSGIWFGLINALTYLIQKQSELSNDSLSLISWIILVFTFHIFDYIISIIKTVYYETALSSWFEVDLNKLKSRKKECYDKVMRDWALNLFMIIPTILLIIYGRTFGNWGYLISLLLTLILFLEWFFLSINGLFKKKYKVTNWDTFKRLFRKSLTRENITKISKNSIVGAVPLILYCLTIIALTSGVGVNINQDIFTINDTVIVEIQPYGLIPPRLVYVFYSNENKLIYNGTNEPFPASYRIIQIPSDMLTDKPYNSHINVITSYIFINGKSYLGDRYLKKIPVYIPLQNEASYFENQNTSEYFLNNSIMLNKSKNNSEFNETRQNN